MAWVAIVVALVMAVVGELLRPKPKFNDPKPSAVGDFSFPTVDASRVIAAWFGTCKQQGPNVVWFGDLEVTTLKKKVKTGWFSSKNVVQGFNYYLGAQLVFGYGPADEFIELRIDDKVAYLTQGPPVMFGKREEPLPEASKDFVGDVCSFYIYSPTILDNNDPPNGVKGQCRLYRGSFTQQPNIYLGAQWDEPDMSAFRPLFYMVMEKCYLGNSDTPPPISVIARRCPNQLGLTGGRHNVNGDANIACAVYEVMTQRMWGMKIPEDTIDVDSFIECGNTLAAEGIGISMLVQTAMLGKDLMAEMLRHADGVVYADPVTGLYTMKLARADYDEDDLMIIDNSNIVPDTFEFSRASWELTKNVIIVQYTDRKTFDTKPVTYQELANIDARNGMIDAEEYSYLGFSNQVAALNTAARISKMKGSPLVSAKMSLDRTGYKLRPGSVFRLQKPDRGLANIISRVIEIDYGTLDDPAIKLTMMEDVFAVKSVAYNPPGDGDWVRPNTGVAPLAQQRLMEAPFFGAEDPSRRFVMTIGTPGSGATLGYDVYSDPTGSTGYYLTNSVDTLTPSGVLSTTMLRTGPEVDNAGIIIGAVNGATGIDPGETGSRENGENLLLIGNELIAWQNIVNNNNGTYTVTGLFRAVLDTAAEDHAPGERVYFISEGAGVTSEEGYPANVTVRAKLLPRSVTEILPLASATEMSVTTNNRAQRPLPPGRMRINGSVVGASAAFTGSFNFTWANRNRMDQTIASQAEAARAPEEGTRYNVRIYSDANVLLASKLDVSAAAVSGTAILMTSGTMRLEIESVRAGLTSWSKLVAYFSYTAVPGTPANTVVIDEPTYVLDGGGA